jgi:hypothetical protein
VRAHCAQSGRSSSSSAGVICIKKINSPVTAPTFAQMSFFMRPTFFIEAMEFWQLVCSTKKANQE